MFIIFVFSHRNREVRRLKDNMKAGNFFGFLCQDISELEHSMQIKLPRVSVVMPLKGFGEHNLQNWRSQVRMQFNVTNSSLRSYINLSLQKTDLLSYQM